MARHIRPSLAALALAGTILFGTVLAGALLAADAPPAGLAKPRPIPLPLGLDLYMPVPEDNPVTTAKIELGRKLFHDKRLSRDQSLACASCHNPDDAFSGDLPKSVGAFGRVGPRNVPAILNRGYGEAFFWDGHIPTLEQQVLQPILNPVEMDLTLEAAEQRTGLSTTEISKVLATYVRSIVSGNSPYDRYLFGDRTALTPQQRRGLEIFRGKGNCINCHVGPRLSDEDLHNTGVAYLNDADPTDLGAGAGNFKTPTLREVARTAPYMHNGSLATLEDVVAFYSGGGEPNPNLDPDIRRLDLADDEQRDLVAFLRSFSGTVLEGGAPVRRR